MTGLLKTQEHNQAKDIKKKVCATKNLKHCLKIHSGIHSPNKTFILQILLLKQKK